jgi:hypothetical protein
MSFDLDRYSYIGTTSTNAPFGIAQDLAMGRGVALLDPHGDLAERALALIPTKRHHQLVYLSPADLERPTCRAIGTEEEQNSP